MNDAELALMAKMRLLYERSGTADSFLTFNVSLPLTEEDLDFVGGGDGTGDTERERRQRKADFATMVNHIPAVDPVWTPQGRYLSDVYGSVFQLGEVADMEFDPEVADRVAAARAVLYEMRESDVPDPITGDPGVEQVPTPEHELYVRYQQEWFDALAQLNEARITAEYADDGDAAERPDGSTIEELQQRRADAMTAWVERGYKAEVEWAKQEIARLGPSGPGLLWEEWKQEFEIDRLSQETNPETDEGFFPASYAPTDFLRSGGWTTVTLDESEIESLVTHAHEKTPELVGTELVRADVETDLEIERLSVELARVGITRPWFEPEVVHSRIWKWQFDRELLSDGGDPPRGIMPAYATSIIFARNLEITLKPDSKANEEVVKSLQEGKQLWFGPMALQQVASTAKPQAVQTLQTAKFDPRETLAIREVNRGLAATKIRDHRAIELKTDNADVVATSPRVADFTSVMAVNRVTASNATRVRPRARTAAVPRRSVTVASRRPAPTVTVQPKQPLQLAHRVTLAKPLLLNTTFGRPNTTVPARRGSPKPSGYEGTVVERRPDGTTGSGIAGAQVTFEHRDGSVRKSVQTDDEGAYRVELPAGDYVVIARKYGYEEFTTAPGVFNCRGDGFQTGPIRMKLLTEIETWESVQLIGFVCEKLPKSPNPAQDLTWT